jgi:hypothetical protein
LLYRLSYRGIERGAILMASSRLVNIVDFLPGINAENSYRATRLHA